MSGIVINLSEVISSTCRISTFDLYRDLEHPTICSRPETVHDNVKVLDDLYDACHGSHAIAVCTEWDMFKVK